jgi:hypothetical protein
VNLDFPTRCTDLETVLNVCCARLVREVKHMFSLYDSEDDGFLNYARMTEMLRELGVLKDVQKSSVQSHQDRRDERSLLLRLWSNLVPDGSQGVKLPSLMNFVIDVVIGNLDQTSTS